MICDYEGCLKEAVYSFCWGVDWKGSGGIGEPGEWDNCDKRKDSCEEHSLIIGLSEDTLPEVVYGDNGRDIKLETELEKYQKLRQETFQINNI